MPIIRKQTKFRFLGLALVLATFTSCTTCWLKHDSQSQLLVSVTNQFFQLKAAGKVPGLVPNEHGDLQSEPLPRNETITYPCSIILDVTKEHDHLSYKLTKDNTSSAWRLTEAWRVLPDGTREDLKHE
jgi:hypothetical protein